MVEEWLRRFKGDRAALHRSRHKDPCDKLNLREHDAPSMPVRQVPVAVSGGHLSAKPARNTSVTNAAKRMFKVTRRERAERGALRLPTREEFVQLVDKIRTAGLSDCKAAAALRPALTSVQLRGGLGIRTTARCC